MIRQDFSLAPTDKFLATGPGGAWPLIPWRPSSETDLERQGVGLQIVGYSEPPLRHAEGQS
jgi:hypothetical protein